MQTYTNRYKYRTQVKQQTSLKSNIMLGVGILLFAIVANIIVELPLYQQLIVALS